MIRLADALRRKLGDPDARGQELDYECPKCSNGKKKLGVNLSRRVFNCFRCHWSGSLAALMESLGIDPMDVSGQAEAVVREKIKPHSTSLFLSIPGFVKIGTPGLTTSLTEADCLKFCRDRAKLNPVDVMRRGWGFSSDPWLAHRLVIPVKVEGKTVQYLARSMKPWVEPKEKSGPEAAGWWPKSEVAYGLDDVRHGDLVVLVEGVWDREAVVRAGCGPCVALLGTSAGPAVVGAIAQKKPECVVIMFDGDEPGEVGSVKLAAYLTRRKLPVYVARPPEGKDPDELEPGRIRTLIKDAEPAVPWLTRSAGQLTLWGNK